MILGNPKESGVDLAVALLNTWDTYDDPPEHLERFEDLQLFLELVGRPRGARSARPADLAAVKAVRDRMRGVFETADVAEAVEILNGIAAEAGAVPHLDQANGDWVVHYGPDEDEVVGHLAATAAGALLEVVRAHGLGRFGTCAASPCTGVYVDRTKNRRKRYSCELCADRAAQRDHRARLAR